MITDNQLDTIAVSFGMAAMMMIILFHLIQRNTTALKE
ncbi:dolichyl-diphosphooligosaccharide--protein glycosyltransferase subunit Ost4p [Trichomonascus vanleenenianus]